MTELTPDALKSLIDRAVEVKTREQRAQISDLRNALEKLKRESIMGQGGLAAKPGPTRDELAGWARAKIESTSLGDLLEEISKETGTPIEILVGKPAPG